MSNKEKFLALVSDEKSNTVERSKERIKNRAMLKESQIIALKVLQKLDYLKWSQADLAREMWVSPQQISKIVCGKENLTIETQIKLQNILDIPILASYYEERVKQSEIVIVKIAVDKIIYSQDIHLSETSKTKEKKISASLDLTYSEFSCKTSDFSHDNQAA